ncbi:MAG: DEAD/DEAH box helicase [Rhizobiales bacterium]|nr:DEAD/DEAH box helicase [Hyphomicrobiales bacterium]
MTSFDGFGLAEPIARALRDEKYVTPTPIQAQTIPLALGGRDIVGIAQTGTGKTAAFALPILNQILKTRRAPEKKTCRVLVLSPTRELAGQIVDSFKAYGRHMKVNVTLAIGGVPMGRQVRALIDGVEILVATPGRLLDLVRGNALRLNKVDVLVLDEADRMLDMGFIHDIRQIVAKVPAERQTLFFSATMPQAIAQLAGQMLRNPAEVAVTPVATTAERIEQRIVHVDHAAKVSMLSTILKSEPIDRAIVFTRTKHGADKVVRNLARANITAEAIHGNKSQGQRERALASFRQGRVRILIATDIAARGIDVDGISHVVNYDLPNVPESYVHRIGRTARAGADGIAISLCTPDEAPYLRSIEKLIRMKIPATGEQRTAAPQHKPRNGVRAAGPRAHAPGREGERPSGERSGRRRRRNRNGSPGQKSVEHRPAAKDAAGQHGRPRGAQSRGRSDQHPRP